MQRKIREAKKRAPNVVTLLRDARGNTFGLRWIEGRMEVKQLRRIQP